MIIPGPHIFFRCANFTALSHFIRCIQLSPFFHIFSARLKYMLDVLLAVKNNNVNKIPQYDPSLAEHLRKILKMLLVNGKYVTSLNITMDDLLKADQRGKWWVVGSAWSGNVDDIGVAKSMKSGKKEQMKFSEKMLELAKKQRMNTDDRRNVFCVLMTAEVSVFLLGRLSSVVR